MFLLEGIDHDHDGHKACACDGRHRRTRWKRSRQGAAKRHPGPCSGSRSENRVSAPVGGGGSRNRSRGFRGCRVLEAGNEIRACRLFHATGRCTDVGFSVTARCCNGGRNRAVHTFHCFRPKRTGSGFRCVWRGREAGILASKDCSGTRSAGCAVPLSHIFASFPHHRQSVIASALPLSEACYGSRSALGDAA